MQGVFESVPKNTLQKNPRKSLKKRQKQCKIVRSKKTEGKKNKCT